MRGEVIRVKPLMYFILSCQLKLTKRGNFNVCPFAAAVDKKTE